MKRYLISMAVRTVCVVLAVVVAGPLRWVFIAGAVILPYVAVVMANAVGERRQHVDPVATADLTALPASRETPHEPAHIYVSSAEARVTSTERVIPGSGERTA